MLDKGQDYPTPDWTYDPDKDIRVGLRPYRVGGICLKAEPLGTKLVVHNYGHGGAGITMAPGSTHHVLELLKASGRLGSGTPVAVIGAGIMGLSIACKLLLETEAKVTIYAKEFKQLTSDVAGGQWSASYVEKGDTPEQKRQFDDILRKSFTAYNSLIDQDYGVYKRLNYSTRVLNGFNKLPSGLIKREDVARLPFAGHHHKGYLYRTLLIETSTYLGRLRKTLDDQQIKRVPKTFASASELGELSETVIVNCVGVGARHMWDDRNVQSWKGHLIMLRPMENSEYLFSNDPGHVFPLSNAIAIGGTKDICDWSMEPDKDKCAGLIADHKHLFSGQRRLLEAASGRAYPEWMTTDS